MPARKISQHDRLIALLAELEQESGPIELEVIEEVRRAWPEARAVRPAVPKRATPQERR
jgi:hypothetical protein